MQLTKLEIKGFKSFGEKVVINFDKGITGIVGPNGCGKSNVVDSIRWVLGEQKTKALRSEKMENIIFNGTRNRKASQLAEVSLSFSNTKNLLPTEYSQITITRRYYRSGESEYLLNNVTCRLKDITNLFLDTGIASNSYAIIELKMVDDILNDKDGSRRALFEEAAGISKFKIRKKETLRKLNDTDADLDRVEDLLFEIEKNLKSLERQAKQAKRYYEIKDQYKLASIVMTRKSVASYKETLDNLEKSISLESDRKVGLNKMLQEKEATVERSKKDLILKEKQLSGRQKTLNEHVNSIRQYESEKKIKNERLRFLNDRFTSLEDQINQDKKSNERAAFSIQSLHQERQVAEKILNETNAEVNLLKAEYEEQRSRTSSLQAHQQSLQTSAKELTDASHRLEKELEIKQMQISSLKSELDKTTLDNTSHSEAIESFSSKLLSLEKEKDSHSNRLDYLKSKHEEQQSRITHSRRTIEVIREELTLVTRKLDARQNEYSLTKSLVDNLEGFPEAIKFLKKQSSWGKDAPLLSDVISTTEEYRVTIENFIEPFMNYYIVESEAHAFEAVNMLSDAAKGKAHFFILDAFENFKATPNKILSGAISATEVVEYDDKYRHLVSYLLDNVYITSGPENRDKSEDATFISKSGRLTRRKNSVSGGSVGLFEGKRIGRAKNLEKLEKQIKSLKQKQEEVKVNLFEKQKDLERLQESDFTTDIDKAQKDLTLISEEHISLRTRSEQLQNVLSQNLNKREDFQEKILLLQEEIDQIAPQVSAIKTDQKKSESELTEIQSSFEANNELLSEKSAIFNQKNILFHQHQNKLASVTQEIEFKQSSFDTSKLRIEKSLAELKDTEQEIKKLMNKTETSDEELISMYEEKENIEKGLTEAEKDYYHVRGTIDQVEKETRELQKNREKSDQLQMELNNRINEVKLNLSGIKERLSVEFQVDLDEVNKSKPDEQSAELDQMTDEMLKEKVRAFKKRLDNMGPINPMAVEAYEEIKERHVFITTQKQDLAKAKESLLNTISEIDSVARDTFMDAFLKIKDNFMNVFRSLFTDEDDCDLKLTNPDDPLESAIEIMAKPKGKRPLTINQLSGGEKTLTATSLLFAIYLLKPAPFCIFDEVDAPLDDANIDKFNNIIRTFSDDSQFIIVTHNKRTMASTDIIYGITMIEQGISRVVPVDLREL